MITKELSQKRSKSLPTLEQVRAAAAIVAHAYGQAGDVSSYDWRQRIPLLFPNYVYAPFSAPHADLFEWAEQIQEDTRPRPFVGIWPRGRGKSTIAEILAADLGARDVRTYCR